MSDILTEPLNPRDICPFKLLIWNFRYKGWPAWPCLVYSCCLTWLTGQMLCMRGGLETIGLTTILNRTTYIYISIYKLCLSVYLFVCIQKKLQNGMIMDSIKTEILFWKNTILNRKLRANYKILETYCATVKS